MRLLVTGCGRSGTGYMTQVLRQAGLDVGHETLGRDGAVSWKWCPPTNKRPQFAPILHQVREPLACIGSLTTFKGSSWTLADRFTALPMEGSPVQRAIAYWYFWNKHAERQAALTYRIEGLRARWGEIAALLGVRVSYEEATAGIPQNVNTRPHLRYTWEQIQLAHRRLYLSVRKLAAHYGYEVTDD